MAVETTVTLAQLTAFFGWCSVINVAVLLATTLVLIPLRCPVSRLHARMTGLPESGLQRIYFQYLAFYKISIFVFNLVPYLALKLIVGA